MTRAALVCCFLLLTACPGLTGWSEAIEGFNARIPVPDSGPALPLDSRCGANADCESGQCYHGVCASSITPGLGANCGDSDDCPAAASCQPGPAPQPGVLGAYACTAGSTDGGASCGPTGKLCSVDSDCGAVVVSGCTSSCDQGACRELSCKRTGGGCAQHTQCCSGWICSGADAGTCLPSAAGTLEEGWIATAPDQCVTGGHTTTTIKVCIAPSSCTKAALNGCGASCCNGLVCQASRCCIDTQKACVLDVDCCTNQCLAGLCVDAKIGTNDNCRMLNQLCGDDNDCCTGLCDSRNKQCTLTPLLNDGGTCQVDTRTKKCVNDAGACSVPTAGCQADFECCNGAKCSTTSQRCF